ncbi:hypothetical protein SteCoe_34527 [Stentor coeruleus]|uniref:Uncharacterized protein n=1 Tax=Stentor coeruleus TaxID=5963 RepID=A0A1R2AUJ2_9CILI|nr:hypothetical protein SteCoe_34527 [Stentor coeruleus]
MGIIYLGFSVYNVNKTLLRPILIIMSGILWYNVYKNSTKVIRILTFRYDAMIINSLRRVAKSIKAKLRIMKYFNILSSFLFIAQLICTIIDILYGITDIENKDFNLIIFNAFVEITHAIAVGGICILYIPKSRITLFEIEDFGNTDNAYDVVPMYEARIENVGDEVDSIKPFVMIVPSNEEKNEDYRYKEILIAVPMIQKYARPSLDELHESLLPARINEN